MTSGRAGGLKNVNRSKRIKNWYHLKVVPHSPNKFI